MAFLPLLHYVLLGFSRHVARWLLSNGHEVWVGFIAESSAEAGRQRPPKALGLFRPLSGHGAIQPGFWPFTCNPSSFCGRCACPGPD